MLEHPDITSTLRTGYPRWMQPDEEEYDRDSYEVYCDQCFEESRERQVFGE